MPKKRKTKTRRKKGDSSLIGKVILFIVSLILVAIIIGSLRGCEECTNVSHQPRFGKDGSPDSTLINQKEDIMQLEQPRILSFYMESSGSMNGFLRGGVPTEFKTDIWAIMNYYTQLNPTVTALTTDNKQLSKAGPYTLAQFQTPFNNGGFVSAVSTNVPDMLRYICENVDINNEVAVFISDMQFDPVGSVAPEVLQAQYCTDVAKIFGKFNNGVSLIGAKSKFVYKDGTTIGEAPYYFVLLGKPEMVAYVRNDISIILEEHNRFIDNFETGINYKAVPYEIVPISGCQRSNELAFHGAESGTCALDLQLHLENYRWNLVDLDNLEASLKFESENGSKVDLDSISFDIINEDQKTKSLSRQVTAHVNLSVTGIAGDCDIIKWTFDIPATEQQKFAEYYTEQPNNPAMSYSLDSFIKGMIRFGTVSYWNKDYNYIHISKK